MGDFVLPIFPQGALTSSVMTTVWVGVAVVAFFNLRFGWVLSGLVVPGYLVPLLLTKPWAAAVIFLESLVTYVLAWLLSEALPRLGIWGSFFGRDRFFLIVLLSVAVRLACDGWALPGFGAWLEREWHLVFDYRSNLHSYGLVIIALMANQYWKTGLARGAMALTVTVAMTYAIVRYGLMEFTNFSISNLAYLYEDIAASILASPKAYLILLVVAFIASRMNLLYGWEFSGILIPSLLALQWYQPYKLLTSLVEALIILVLASWLMRTPLLRNANIEGARKLLLFFNVGFAYKIALGYLLPWLLPHVKVTDHYAFGYLLSTLIAVKIHDKDIAARFARVTVQTSLVGVAIASVLGFALTRLPLAELWPEARDAGVPVAVETSLDGTLAERIRNDKILLHQARENGAMAQPLAGELEDFRRALEALVDYADGGLETSRARAAALLQGVGYQLSEIDGRYLYVRERGPARGWGLYVIDRQARDGLMVQVPAPVDERGSYEAGAALFFSTDARALAIAGSGRRWNRDGSSDVLNNPQTLFQVFHQALAGAEVVQVRGDTAQSRRQRAQYPERAASLWVQRSLPARLDLVKLQTMVGDLEVEWRSLPGENRQRERTAEGFVELVLGDAGVRKLRARALDMRHGPRLQDSEQRIDGFLAEWLLDDKERIAGAGSDRYVLPGVDELLFFDEEVLTPLWAAAHSGYVAGAWTARGREDLAAAQETVASFGYRITRYRHQRSGSNYLILYEEASGAGARHWGTYVLRLGEAQGFVVEVPRPLQEVDSLEYGIALFERLQARALLIAGAHPAANRDGSADLVRADNLRSLFTLVGQVLVREAGDAPLLLVQSRARGYRSDAPTAAADALLAVAGEAEGGYPAAPLFQQLLRVLDEDGLSHAMVDGSPATAGYEVSDIPQARYPQVARNKLFALVWLSPDARVGYRQRDDAHQEAMRFAALGIATIEDDLPSLVMRHHGGYAAPPAAMAAILHGYQDNGDVVSLARLHQQWPEYRWQRVLDRDSRQSFLVVSDARERLVMVANLNPRLRDVQVATGTPNGDVVRGFVERRAALLHGGLAP